MNYSFCTTFFFGKNKNGYKNMSSNSLEQHDEIYLKTFVTLFVSLKRYSFEKKLFVNDLDRLKRVREGKYYSILVEELEVRVYEVSSKFVDESKEWAGSMFIFDVLSFIYLNKQQFSVDKWFFVDSDVVFFDYMEDTLKLLNQYDLASYTQWQEFRMLNLWTEDFHGADFSKIDSSITPLGGEFLMLDTAMIEIFLSKFKSFYCQFQDVMHTEENYYSLIVDSLVKEGYKNYVVNPFFKRSLALNRAFTDKYCWGVHFPGQKNYKLKYLYSAVKKNNYNMDISKSKKIMGLNTHWNIYDFSLIIKTMRKLKNKIVKQ
ncbi:MULTISPECIES: hypothetical protein [Lactiplantibacillus]|uniref:hypothetical protein n=1 Tax=Lactiplantibacillus TaxID=2767842 RepID=UPI0015EB83DA|nr:hypothetical protein [Lactiplantibacillus plantarum]MBA3078706.1 hypothetical protein [Lactiplantibacillus plantarum]MBA3084504.1 hypothetical protein [Lactiplantibacillus plantarum]MDY7133476.1 hypothetical protein [Lactiplantibacillus plantarum]